nr:hypothetical protein [Xanthomonas cucurbitae]
MSKAFDKGADLLDNRAIYHQTDKQGVEWQFNGRNGEPEAIIELAQDGLRSAGTQSVVASHKTSQELGALANANENGIWQRQVGRCKKVLKLLPNSCLPRHAKMGLDSAAVILIT